MSGEAATLPMAEDTQQHGDRDNAEYAFGRIRSEILTGQLAPGTVLSQANLARALGISRTPLREALNRLVSEGLVIGGEYNQRMRVSELDLDDFDQIYAARIALEPIAIVTTVALLDDGAKHELDIHLSAMDAAIESLDLEAFRNHHRLFHMGLTSLAGDRIDRLLTDLWDNSERYRLAYLHYDYSTRGDALVERLEVSQHEHRVMRDAAIAGDGKSCATVLVAHLTRTLDAVFADAADIPRPRVAHQAIAQHKANFPVPEIPGR